MFSARPSSENFIKTPEEASAGRRVTGASQGRMQAGNAAMRLARAARGANGNSRQCCSSGFVTTNEQFRLNLYTKLA
jgi:hypothetical protein